MAHRGPPIRFVALLFLIASLVSCGLVVSFGSYDTSLPEDPLYGVTGTLEGTGASGVTVLLDGLPMRIEQDGPFAFPKKLRDHARYLVSDAVAPALMCTIERGMGTIEGADATGVAIHCVPSNDATLTGLKTAAGDLSTAFDEEIFVYDVVPRISVGGILGMQTTVVTATVKDVGARIVIAGMAVPSGQPSPPIRILPEPTRIDIVVTAADTTTQQHYALVINAPSAYLKASNTREDALFGSSVAVAGDTVAVGSEGETSKATGVNGSEADSALRRAGAVYVFTRAADGVWSQQAYLKASNTHEDAGFGSSLALSASGDTLVVGSAYESGGATGVNGSQAVTTSGTGSGAVYVFTRAGGVWSQQAYLKASNTRPNAAFGFSVAIAGDTLAVGSYVESSAATGVGGDQTDASAPAAGAVYVFTRTGGVWSQQAYVKASNTRIDARFGLSVALSNDTLAVGADGESSGAVGINGNQADVSAPRTGAAYVFVRKGNAWSQQAYIKASNTQAASKASFGWSVALSGDTLAVGACAERSGTTGGNVDAAGQLDTSAPNAGAAYVFTRTGEQWSQQAYLKASNTTDGSFGWSLALSGDSLAVGARSESGSATGVNASPQGIVQTSGAAYVFARVAGTWSQRAYVKASNTRKLAVFGTSIALAGGTLAVGSPKETSNATGVDGDQGNSLSSLAGAAYVFR